MTPERRVILLMLADVVRQRYEWLETCTVAYHALNGDRLARARFSWRTERIKSAMKTTVALREAQIQIRDAQRAFLESLDVFYFAYTQPPTPPDLMADDP